MPFFKLGYNLHSVKFTLFSGIQFYELWQMHTVVKPLPQSMYRAVPSPSKIPWYPLCSQSIHQQPWTSRNLFSVYFAFSRINGTIQPFETGSFHLAKCTWDSFFCCYIHLLFVPFFFFLLLSTVTVYGCTTVGFHSLVEGYLGGAQFGGL